MYMRTEINLVILEIGSDLHGKITKEILLYTLIFGNILYSYTCGYIIR